MTFENTYLSLSIYIYFPFVTKGSVAVAGHAMKWLRDNMGFVKDIQKDTESLAQEVFNTGDVYFVPAFKGLYAPYWRKDARGCVSLFKIFVSLLKISFMNLIEK